MKLIWEIQSALPQTIDDLRIAGSGSESLFKRDYDQGLVLCNTSSSANELFSAGKFLGESCYLGWWRCGCEWKYFFTVNFLSARFPVSVTVDPSQCLILKNDSATGISNTQMQTNSMIVSQNFF